MISLSFSLDIYPEVGLLDHVVVKFLIFEEPPYFSIVATQEYIPTNSFVGFFFLYILTSTFISCILFFFFFYLFYSMWKFPGKGWNPHHSSDLRHCSDKAGSSTQLKHQGIPFVFLMIVILTSMR